jgi:hypothetical protein
MVDGLEDRRERNCPMLHNSGAVRPGGYWAGLVRFGDITGQSLPVFMAASVMMDFLWSDLHMTHQSRS